MKLVMTSNKKGKKWKKKTTSFAIVLQVGMYRYWAKKKIDCCSVDGNGKHKNYNQELGPKKRNKNILFP